MSSSGSSCCFARRRGKQQQTQQVNQQQQQISNPLLSVLDMTIEATFTLCLLTTDILCKGTMDDQRLLEFLDNAKEQAPRDDSTTLANNAAPCSNWNACCGTFTSTENNHQTSSTTTTMMNTSLSYYTLEPVEESIYEDMDSEPDLTLEESLSTTNTSDEEQEESLEISLSMAPTPTKANTFMAASQMELSLLHHPGELDNSIVVAPPRTTATNMIAASSESFLALESSSNPEQLNTTSNCTPQDSLLLLPPSQPHENDTNDDDDNDMFSSDSFQVSFHEDIDEVPTEEQPSFQEQQEQPSVNISLGALQQILFLAACTTTTKDDTKETIVPPVGDHDNSSTQHSTTRPSSFSLGVGQTLIHEVGLPPRLPVSSSSE